MAEPTEYELLKQKAEMLLANAKAILTQQPFSPIASTATKSELETIIVQTQSVIYILQPE